MATATVTISPAIPLGWSAFLIVDEHPVPYELGWFETMAQLDEALRVKGFVFTSEWAQVGASRAHSASLAATPESVRESGMAQVNDYVPSVWRENADIAIRDMAQRLRTFTSDDLWDELAARGMDEPPTPAAIGPVFMRAARADLIFNTGRVRPTKRLQSHRKITVWQSKIAVIETQLTLIEASGKRFRVSAGGV